MSNIYNEEYYNNYDTGNGKVSYSNATDLKLFLQNVADKIVEKYNPKKVLDAGCAMGYLVEALRDRGVEAYGIDISEYAISKVREDIKPFCVVGNLSEPLPKSIPEFYDLIVTIEVIEHIYEAEGLKAISNLCNYSNSILFSSSPDDIEEITHVNVQQREYWAKQFAKHNFFNKIEISNDYLTPWTLYFYKNNDFSRVVEDYERSIRVNNIINKKKIDYLNKENEELLLKCKFDIKDKEENILQLKNKISKLKNEINELEDKILEKDKVNKIKENEILKISNNIENLKIENSIYKEHYNAAIFQRDELRVRLSDLENSYYSIMNSSCWKLTKPLRVTLDLIKRILKSNKYTHLMCKGIKCLKKNGIKYTLKKVKKKLIASKGYNEYAKQIYLSPKARKEQIETVFTKEVLFSIVVPLYNTPEKFLCEMINSCIDQTYGNWELCLADGSDNEHSYVEKIIKNYIKKDKRIKYKKLENNMGISENTNECITMASGDYIALFDHDDLLHPSALYEYMKVICEQNADFIYCDELTFEGTLDKVITMHFKPDFAIDNLRANNYICHFSVFKSELLKETGLFRKEFDGSQDHDIILRLTEKAKNIVHIPKILYYWRSHPNSVAADINSKAYAVDAGKRAVKDHLNRCNLNAIVESSKAFPTIYRIKYDIKINQKISIIIPNKDNKQMLEKCINSILNKSTYENIEIIVVENNSTTTEIFEYYKKLEEQTNIRVVVYDKEKEFNYSAINNFGAEYATGEQLLFLNNDIEIITPNWIEEMLMYSQREDVGAVGAKLYYPNDTIQHAGIILKLGEHRCAGHCHYRCEKQNLGYMGRLYYAQDFSAVTAACMMMKKKIFDDINGFDESFKVAFNDVDLCMRIRDKGYLIVWTPYAEAYHYESISRGYEDTAEKEKRFLDEVNKFKLKWKSELDIGDPYYNTNLTLDSDDFSLK